MYLKEKEKEELSKFIALKNASMLFGKRIICLDGKNLIVLIVKRIICLGKKNISLWVYVLSVERVKITLYLSYVVSVKIIYTILSIVGFY